MSDLTQKRCIPCEGGIPPATQEEITKLMPQLSGWGVRGVAHDDKTVSTLQKQMKFKDFRAAMSFLRKVEDLAESEGHHPDFCVHYNIVDFTLWTHAVGGLHENDFILAAKIDKFVGEA